MVDCFGKTLCVESLTQMQTREVLRVMHAFGAAHYEIKPGNMILRGDAVLIDFDAEHPHTEVARKKIPGTLERPASTYLKNATLRRRTHEQISIGPICNSILCSQMNICRVEFAGDASFCPYCGYGAE